MYRQKAMRRFLQQQNIRTIGLVVSTVIYMLLGAAVFSALEEQTHKRQTKEYITKYNELQSKYNMTEKDIDDLITYLHKRRHLNNWALEPWSFAGSVYFTSVTITTIGKSTSLLFFVNDTMKCWSFSFHIYSDPSFVFQILF